MKRLGMLAKWLRGALLAVWLGALIAVGTLILLFFAGVIVPKVTVRTVIEGWGWIALALTVIIVWSNANRRNIGRILGRPAVGMYAWSTGFIVSAIVLFYVVERWRGHRAWLGLERETRGEVVELRSLEPFPVADEQNFAAVPVVAEWWAASPEGGGGSRLRRLTARVLDGGGAWEIQQPVDLGACLKRYAPAGSEPGGTNDVSAAQFLAAWEEFEPELEQIRSGALRTRARFELPYDRGIFDTALGGKLELFQAVGQAFRLRAVAALRAGTPAVALSEVEQLLRISELVEQEPLLERQRLSLLLAALQPVWEGLSQSQWSEAQLAVLQRHLEDPDLLEEYRRAVRVECLLIVDMLEKLFPVHSTAPATMLSEAVPDRMLILGMRWLYPSGWLLQNQVGVHRLANDLREQTVDLEHHRLRVDVIRQLQRIWVHQPPSLDPFFATFITPRAVEVGQDAGQRYAYAQCALDLAATACALERYRLAHRQLPERLALLAPEWTARVPADVIDGRPLRYRKLEKGRYVLYSVGWNQTDDGGRVAMRGGPLRTWEESLQTRDEGDWVWSATPTP